MNKSICFAYYADGKWIGWYSGTFGGVSTKPKLYSDLEHMRPIIQKNFSHKITSINTSSFEVEKKKVSGLVEVLALATYESEEILRSKQVELRVVECPEYDGPNPDFDKAAYEAECDKRNKLWKEYEAKLVLPEGFSPERSAAYHDFNKEHPRVLAKNWLYADWDKVKAWAAIEPTEFIETLTP